jgi:hypothetical protein
MIVSWTSYNLSKTNNFSSNGTYRVMDFALDALTDVAFSRPLGYLRTNTDLHDYIETVRAYIPVLELRTNIPLVNTLLNNPMLRKLMAPTATNRLGLGKMIGVAKEVAGEKFGPNAEARNGMLGGFVRHD